MYKVLWFDDDFSTEQIHDDDKTKTRREAFLNDAEQANDFGIEYDTACTIEEFENIFQKSENLYQAVIFDIKGLNPNDSSDESGIYKANMLVDKTNGILKYVYSGNIDKPEHKAFLDNYFHKDNIFSKADDIVLLFEKIKSDLDGALDCYQEHMECLQLFNKRYLKGENKTKMDEVMKCYYDSKRTVPLNFIRIIFEDMLLQFASTKQPDVTLDTNKHKERFNYIVRDCHKDINGNFDYTNPKVPYSECPQAVKYCIEFTWNMTNINSHNQPHPAFLSPSDYEVFSKKAIYNAFFATMKWYYRYMNHLMAPSNGNH